LMPGLHRVPVHDAAAFRASRGRRKSVTQSRKIC
jgi:hypothetical protein